MRTHIVCLSALALSAWVGCKDPNAGVPRATTSAAPSAPVAAPPVATAPNANEHLTFGPPESSIGFTGAKVTGSHNGTFGAFTGSIDLDGAHPENSRMQVSIEMASMSADVERLTNHLKSADFFDVARFPTSTFTSTAITVGGAGGATHTAIGTLTLHGQAREITFPVTVAVTPTAVTARSEFVINRRDFGIVYAGMPDNLIRDEVTIRFSIRAARGAAPSARPAT